MGIGSTVWRPPGRERNGAGPEGLEFDPLSGSPASPRAGSPEPGRPADEAETVPGSTAKLPEDETLLWSGRPSIRSLAVRVFHLRKILIYFALLLVWRAWTSRGAADPMAHFAVGSLRLAAAAALAAGIVFGLAWLTRRHTRYTLTDRRVIFRIGAAFPKIVNVPLAEVEAAAAREHGDGSGDLALRPRSPDAVPYYLLWPHARPWTFDPPEPALRCVPEVGEVAGELRRALAAVGPSTRGTPPGRGARLGTSLGTTP